MRTFDVQSIEVDAPARQAFEYIADTAHLPEWTSAFRSIRGRRAVLSTSDGALSIDIDVQVSRERGTIDWAMTFPDGSIARAFSRVVDSGKGRAIYSFVLLPPPVPLERIEGALDHQSRILGEELVRLKQILESRRERKMEDRQSPSRRPALENG